MLKISIATWIANAAACLTGVYGDVTHQAEAVDCGRQTVSDQAHKVQAAVAAEHACGPTRTEPNQEDHDLRHENARDSGTGWLRPLSSPRPSHGSSPSRPRPWA